MLGRVTWFNNSKGYGFIGRDDGPDVFVHYSGVLGEGYKTLDEGDAVEFEIVQGPKGPQASNVTRRTNTPHDPVVMEKEKPDVPLRLTAHDPKNPRAKNKLNTSAPTLLICDDNPNIRYLLRTFVETRTPFKICGEAEHGMEAIDKAKDLQPDLILLDLSMPIMTGAEAAIILKDVVPRMKIILFSMLTDDVPRSMAERAGIDLTLSKSDGITKLADHLHALLTPAD